MGSRQPRVFQVASQLETTELLASEQGRQRYSGLITSMAAVLRSWGDRRCGDTAWRSLLEMPSLLHEVEEAIVPLVRSRNRATSASASFL